MLVRGADQVDDVSSLRSREWRTPDDDNDDDTKTPPVNTHIFRGD